MDRGLFMVYFLAAAWRSNPSVRAVTGSRRATGLKFHEFPMKKSEII
jgi:hypothetical protein